MLASRPCSPRTCGSKAGRPKRGRAFYTSGNPAHRPIGSRRGRVAAFSRFTREAACARCSTRARGAWRRPDLARAARHPRRRNHASWALAGHAGALEEIMERFGARISRTDNFARQALILVGIAQEMTSEGGHRELAPAPSRNLAADRDDGPARPRFDLPGRSVDGDGSLRWPRRALDRVRRATARGGLRRAGGSGVSHAVDGPPLGRLAAGLPALGRRRRATLRATRVRVLCRSRHLPRAAGDRRDPAWGRAVAVRVVVLSPIPVAVGMALGFDAARFAFENLKRVFGTLARLAPSTRSLPGCARASAAPRAIATFRASSASTRWSRCAPPAVERAHEGARPHHAATRAESPAISLRNREASVADGAERILLLPGASVVSPASRSPPQEFRSCRIPSRTSRPLRLRRTPHRKPPSPWPSPRSQARSSARPVAERGTTWVRWARRAMPGDRRGDGSRPGPRAAGPAGPHFRKSRSTTTPPPSPPAAPHSSRQARRSSSKGARPTAAAFACSSRRTPRNSRRATAKSPSSGSFPRRTVRKPSPARRRTRSHTSRRTARNRCTTARCISPRAETSVSLPRSDVRWAPLRPERPRKRRQVGRRRLQVVREPDLQLPWRAPSAPRKPSYRSCHEP